MVLSEKFVIDESAWLEYFAGTERGKHVRDALARATLYTTGITVAGVCMVFLKNHLPVEDAVTAMTSLSIIIPFNEQIGEETARIQFGQNVPFMDAHIRAAAKIVRAKIISDAWR